MIAMVAVLAIESPNDWNKAVVVFKVQWETFLSQVVRHPKGFLVIVDH
jgi:hypothetical protein